MLVLNFYNARALAYWVYDNDGVINFTYNLNEMAIKKPKRWDGKWRIVLFDIPEKIRKTRDIFRHHLNQLEFYEFQKSVFVHPFDCHDEIDYLIEFYNARKFVRFIVAESLDNELHLKKKFNLLN